MATDNSTTAFIVCIIIGFLLVRWYVSPSASSTAPPVSSNGSTPAVSANLTASTSASRGASGGSSGPGRRRRQVTMGMIEVVQSVAPTLTIEQIRYDLERSGSVESTIDRFLAEGGLPMVRFFYFMCPTLR